MDVQVLRDYFIPNVEGLLFLFLNYWTNLNIDKFKLIVPNGLYDDLKIKPNQMFIESILPNLFKFVYFSWKKKK